MSDGITPPGRIRAPRQFWSGLFLVGLCLFVFWANAGMSQGTLEMMGAAMFPRILAVMIGLGGAALVVLSLRHAGPPLEGIRIRGPFFVTVSVLAFAFTIRSMGLSVASFLALMLGGCATPETRFREILLFSVAMTVFGVVLFHYFLGMSVKVLILPGTRIGF